MAILSKKNHSFKDLHQNKVTTKPLVLDTQNPKVPLPRIPGRHRIQKTFPNSFLAITYSNLNIDFKF